MQSLNARMSANDPRLYNVNRDIAHNFEFVIKATAEDIEKANWTAATDVAKQFNVTPEDMGKVCRALCLFTATTVDVRGESMATALARCGFLELNQHARVLVMAHIGKIILGMHWGGVHETTLNGNGPALTYQSLKAYGDKFAALMRMSWLSRRWYLWKMRLRRAWIGLTKKELVDG